MDESRSVEVALILRCREGDSDAIRKLVHQYEGPVYHIIWRTVGNLEDARDLTQETFVKAIRALESFDTDRPFRNWIFRIASNLAIDHLRRRRLRTVSIDVDEGDDRRDRMRAPVLIDPGDRPDEAHARVRLSEKLERLVAQLPPDYRTVVHLRHREQLAYEEIAQVLQIPLGTVKARLHRAHQRLRALWIGEEEGTPPPAPGSGDKGEVE
jgi:RNA polymerase sigma-70 factor (ECF subfamily)